MSMSISLLQTFVKKHGNHQHLDANSPLPLIDSESCWFVVQGRLDVFYVKNIDDLENEERTQCFSVKVGQVTFGIPAGTQGMLLAVGIPETKVYRLNRSALNLIEDKQTSITLINTYLETMASAIARSVESPPQTEFILYPEGSTEISSHTIARPAEGPCSTDTHLSNLVVWAKVSKGKVLYMDTEDMTSDHSWIPIAFAAWIMPLKPASLDLSSTRKLFQAAHFWDYFDKYQEMALNALSMNLTFVMVDRFVALREKTKLDEQVVHASLLGLTSAVKNSSRMDADDSLDPLIVACSLVAQQLRVNMQGRKLTGKTVEEVAESGAMRYRIVMLRENWFTEDGGPMVGFLAENGRPVALLPSSPNSYALHDPLNNQVKKIKKGMEDILEPSAYTLYKPLPSKKTTLGEFISFGVSGHARDLIWSCILGALIGLTGLITPMLNETIFNDIIPGAARNRLFQVVAIIIGFSVSSLLFNITKSVAILRYRTQTSSYMETSLWDRILRLPVNFFREYSAGDLAQRAMAITSTQHLMSRTAIDSISSSSFAAFYLIILLFYYDTKMALLASTILVFSTLVTALVYFFQIKLQRKLATLSGKISGITLQFITGIMKLRAGGAEDRAFAIWAEDFTEQRILARKIGTIGNGLGAFNTGFEVIGSGFIFAGVIFFSHDTNMDMGTFMAFWAAFGSLQSHILSLVTGILSLSQIIPHFERLEPILAEEPEDTEIKKNPGDLRGNIEFSNVCFSYSPDSPLITKNVSFRVKPNSFVAITGPSGAGKTTLLRLLLGFEIPKTGSIFFEGQDTSQLDMAQARKQMGVVLQDGGLLPGDIFTNIIGVSNLTLDDAWAAATMAGLDQDIKEMPMGMNTVISEGATTLSGGQKQRLIIARALARKPSVLIFDEATSALDNLTQKIVTQSLNQLSVTRIVIAHRLSTIKEADTIIVIKDGEINDSGTYDELSKRKGLFHELVKRQIA